MKKTFKKTTAALLSLIMACSVGTTAFAAADDKEPVTLNAYTVKLGVGETFTLSGSSAGTYEWVSLDGNVSVSNSNTNKAIIRGEATGEATVRVGTENNDYAYCKVIVMDAPQSVAVDNPSFTIGVGESLTIRENTAANTYANSSNISWKTSDKTVAAVTKGSANKATVKGVKVGKATVTVKLYNGVTANCSVNVKPAPSKVEVKPQTVTLGVGESVKISECTNAGSYANAANLKWSSSNSNVTVTKGEKNQAVITGAKTGTADVKIKLYNGKTAACKVTVKPAPNSVSINTASIKLGVGETAVIKESTNSGSYANAANLNWTSQNTSIAAVTKHEANKAYIKGLKAGTTDVTIKLYNGKTATCKVTVLPAPKSVKLDLKLLYPYVGETWMITESTDKGSYANAANLKWTSSNTKVAKISSHSSNKCYFKITGTGETTITVKTFNGKTASCRVIVHTESQRAAAAKVIAQDIANTIPKNLSKLDRVRYAAATVQHFSDWAQYTSDAPEYGKPYGVFNRGVYTCAGCTRALGAVLECMGIQYTHVNESQWTHQWCEFKIDGKKYWADGQIGYAGAGEHFTGIDYDWYDKNERIIYNYYFNHATKLNRITANGFYEKL